MHACMNTCVYECAYIYICMCVYTSQLVNSISNYVEASSIMNDKRILHAGQ